MSILEREWTGLADGLNVRVRKREILSFVSEQLGEGFAVDRWGGLKEKLPWVEIECHLDIRSRCQSTT